MVKILFNLVTISREEIYIRWLLKIKTFQEKGGKVSLYGGVFLKDLEPIIDVYNYKCLTLEQQRIPLVTWTKLNFLIHCIKRNIISLSYIKRILDSKYDVIYSPSSVLDLVILPYLLTFMDKNLKWVVALDNVVKLDISGNKIFGLIAWLSFRLSLVLLKKADLIYVFTEDIKEYMLRIGFSEKRLILTGGAVEANMILEAKKETCVEYDALYIGRINEKKGIFDMLEVLSLVKVKYPLFRLAIMGVGDPPTENLFREEVAKKDLRDNIVFLGYRTGKEKFNLIKSSKCFWFFSKTESFGIALLEAVCSGLHAFAYDLPPFRSIYTNGEIHTFRVGDTKRISKEVLDLFETKDFDNKKGRLLLKKNSWEAIAKIEYNALKRLYD